MRRTFRRSAAAVYLLGGLFVFPGAAAAQKALVYCPADDSTGCAGIVAALTPSYGEGVDRGYDGSGGTVDLANADLAAYAVFVVPSLADDDVVQPYARLRDGGIAERLRDVLTGRAVVWSGTPDLGSANRDKKDALIRNLAAWAQADAEAGRGTGIVALLDASGTGAYGWLGGVAGATVSAGAALDVYANVEVRTATGTALLASGGLQLGYTNMASGALAHTGGTVAATGGRTSNAVLVTFAGTAGGGGIATVTTDKEDYAPGETVTITGTGWEPGETVLMSLHEEPLVHGDRTLSAVADADGNIFNDSFKPEEHDLGVRFVLTAVGQASGRTAQTTFTDDRLITAVTVNGGSAVTVAPGTSVSVAVTVSTTTTGGGGDDWLSTSYVISTTAPASPNYAGTICVNTPDHTSPGTFTETFAATAPASSGTYNLYVIAWRTAGCGNNASNLFIVSGAITVAAANSPPVADAGGPYSSSEGTAVALTGASATDDGPSGSLTYAWSYAAGAGVDAGATCSFTPSSSVIQPSVTCTDDGTFTLTLTVTDGAGASDSDDAALTISNVAPTASAGGPHSGSEGSSIPLLGSGNDAGANDIPGLTYLWTVDATGIDAGGTCAITNPAQANASVSCTDDGAFSVSLQVSDGDGGTTTSSTTLSVANALPTANAGGPYGGAEGAAIQLSGSGSDAGANDGLTYKWTAITTGIDGGGTCTFDDDTNQDAVVTCTDDGGFQVSLVVTDDDGGASVASLADLTVGNAAPVANANGPYSGNEGSPVQLNGSVTDAGPNDTHTWSWAYVDGTGIDGGTCQFSNAGAEDPTVTCTDDGTVELTLTVTDDDGESHSDSATLTLANVDPVPDAGGSYSGAEGSAVQLTGSVTDAGLNDTHTWSWAYLGTNVDPGASCTFSDAASPSPTVTCTDDGTVQLTLTVTDDDGGEGEDTATLTLSNVAPVAAAGGPYTGAEGAGILLAGSGTDAGTNDLLSYLWSVDASGIDGGGTCSFDDATAAIATLTCTDDGSASLTLKVTDDDGGSSTSVASVVVSNADPIADAGGPYGGDEGAAVSVAGSGTDPGSNDVLTYAWSYAPSAGVDAGATCTFTAPAAAATSVSCTDDGAYQLTLTVSDDDGGSDLSTAALTIANVAPLLSAITAPMAPVDMASPVNVSSTYSDEGTNDTHAGTIDWGDGSSSAAVVAGAGGSGTASGTHTYAMPGVYTITMTLSDDDGASATSEFKYVVVYDPNGGFVTGGGWIMSQPGMYLPDPALTGKANFGFVSKYQKGATVPTGNTEFQFHAGDLNFKSTSYEWLVVQGKEKASYKGVGRVNGTGDYGFMLTVADGGSTDDRFRIRIWDRANGDAVVYDNQAGAPLDAAATTVLGGGSIVVHIPNGKVATK